jgi:hypothetical protein
MHAIILTRGIKHDVDRMINELSCTYLPFKYKGNDVMLQVGVRPYQMWEIVFPREHKDIMLTTLFGNHPNHKNGQPQHSKHQFAINMMRKTLGVDPIPDHDTSRILPVYRGATEVTGIGIKEDYNFEDGTEGI